jgi:uncharacterized protein (DUF1800 family)
MALNPLNDILGFNRAAHLLRRTVFGASPETIRTFAILTPQQAMEQLFREGIESPTLPIDPATGVEWIKNGITDANSENFNLQSYLLQWQIGQFLGGNTTEENKLSYIFRERIVFFLHTHFTTIKSTVGNTISLYYQNELFRLFAFDKFLDPSLNFKSLAKKITVDNAMLRFLDGRLNVKGNPNENFAREFFELYTVGRGLEGATNDSADEGDYGTFTEEDVQQSARILSGFDVDNNFSTIDEETGLPSGKIKGNGLLANQHDNGVKMLSPRFNNAVIQPNAALLLNGEPTRESALDEIQQLVDAIFDQEETDKHLARKVYRFFGYHDITSSIEESVITDLARIFINSDYSLQAMLEAFLTSKEFYDGSETILDDSYGSIIKSPLDLAIGYARSFELKIPDYTIDYTGFYEVTSLLRNKMGDMGLDFYEPFEVAGYSAYHQFPIYHRSWITTTYLTQRYSFIQYLNFNTVNELQLDMLTPITFVERFIDNSAASNARSLVEEVCKHFFPLTSGISFEDNGSELTAVRLNYFLDAFLLSFEIDEQPEETWTFRWTNKIDRETVSRQLIDLFNSVLQSPEYQLS